MSVKRFEALKSAVEEARSEEIVPQPPNSKNEKLKSLFERLTALKAQLPSSSEFVRRKTVFSLSSRKNDPMSILDEVSQKISYDLTTYQHKEISIYTEIIITSYAILAILNQKNSKVNIATIYLLNTENTSWFETIFFPLLILAMEGNEQDDLFNIIDGLINSIRNNSKFQGELAVKICSLISKYPFLCNEEKIRKVATPTKDNANEFLTSYFQMQVNEVFFIALEVVKNYQGLYLQKKQEMQPFLT